MATFQVRKAKNGDRRYRVIIRRHGEQISRTSAARKRQRVGQEVRKMPLKKAPFARPLKLSDTLSQN